MDKQKNSVISSQEKIEELSDAQLSEVSGGFEIPTITGPVSIPTIQGNGKPYGVKFGQALEKPSCFGKSDDRPPSNDGF